MEKSPITTEILEWMGVCKATLIRWCRKYRVDGKPLGVKVGGRWVVYPSRLAKFKEVGNEEEA